MGHVNILVEIDSLVAIFVPDSNQAIDEIFQLFPAKIQDADVLTDFGCFQEFILGQVIIVVSVDQQESQLLRVPGVFFVKPNKTCEIDPDPF